MVKEFNRRRDLFVPGLNTLRGLSCLLPRGAFYAWVDIRSTGMRSDEFCRELLETEFVSCVPGTAFGPSGEGYVRFSYANSYERLAQALQRLERFCGV
jgi:aminotransferase